MLVELGTDRRDLRGCPTVGTGNLFGGEMNGPVCTETCRSGGDPTVEKVEVLRAVEVEVIGRVSDAGTRATASPDTGTLVRRALSGEHGDVGDVLGERGESVVDRRFVGDSSCRSNWA